MLTAATPEASADALLVIELSTVQALADERIEHAGAAARSDTLARSLDQMRYSVKLADEAEHRIVGSSVAVSASFSVGYVIWLLRGGVLATSLLSSLPAWRFVDPLPVLTRMREARDDDSLESLVAAGDQADIKDRNAGSGRLGTHEPNFQNRLAPAIRCAKANFESARCSCLLNFLTK